jgi:lambda family phage portal protein
MIDALVKWWNPQAAVDRVLARRRLDMLSGSGLSYDAARRNHRTSSWRTVGTAPNDLHRADASRLRDVARELVRNNAHAERAVRAICDGLVGHGIIPTIAGTDDQVLVDRLESLLVRLADSAAIDFDGRENLYGLQHTLVGTVVRDGEALVIRHWQNTLGGSRLPIRLQVIEPDLLNASIDGDLKGGNYAVRGVEFDRSGRRVAYHIHDTHPSASGFRRLLDSKRWPAADVIHVFRVDRPGQVRGFSWFAPVALPMNDYRDYMDAQLVRQRLAASFAAFVRKLSAGGNPLSPGDKSAAGHKLEAIEAGLIEYLNPDEDIVFANPPSVDGVDAYSKITLRAIAAGLGIDYAAFTGDYGDQNFAGGRIGHLRYQRTLDGWHVKMLLPALDRLGDWFVEAMEFMASDLTGSGLHIAWSPPVREMYDPVKETTAAERAILAGLSSRWEEQRRRGFDPKQLDRESAAAAMHADELKIRFTSDGRYSSGAPFQTDEVNNA